MKKPLLGLLLILCAAALDAQAQQQTQLVNAIDEKYKRFSDILGFEVKPYAQDVMEQMTDPSKFRQYVGTDEFGESRLDKRVTTLDDLRDLPKFRAQQQAKDQIGVLKIVGFMILTAVIIIVMYVITRKLPNQQSKTRNTINHFHSKATGSSAEQISKGVVKQKIIDAYEELIEAKLQELIKNPLMDGVFDGLFIQSTIANSAQSFKENETIQGISGFSKFEYNKMIDDISSMMMTKYLEY